MLRPRLRTDSLALTNSDFTFHNILASVFVSFITTRRTSLSTAMLAMTSALHGLRCSAYRLPYH